MSEYGRQWERMREQQRPLEEAERAGYDAGKNGANTTNTHFRFFASPDLRDAWTKGNKRALDEKGTGTP